MHDPILAIHIAAGTGGLLLGAVALPSLLSSEGGRPYGAYQVAIALVSSTAVVLVALDWGRLWWLLIFAVGVQGAALAALWAPHAAFAGWRGWRVRFAWGTYVGLLTALLVVSWSTPLAWVIPTLIGVPVIERAAWLASRPAPSRPP